MKPKLPVKYIQEQLPRFYRDEVSLYLHAELPDPNLYHFEGTIYV